MKEQYVEFHLRKMKPNTRLYPFLDNIAISGYAIPDRNYSGTPGSSLGQWGENIITDDAGNASGVILIPSGRKPAPIPTIRKILMI